MVHHCVALLQLTQHLHGQRSVFVFCDCIWCCQERLYAGLSGSGRLYSDESMNLMVTGLFGFSISSNVNIGKTFFLNLSILSVSKFIVTKVFIILFLSFKILLCLWICPHFIPNIVYLCIFFFIHQSC